MVKVRWVLLSLTIIFCLRFYFSTLKYNPDIWNHQAWMESVERDGWSGLYEREMGERARVNYPPIALYSFYASEKLYQQLPMKWQNELIRAAMYKLPSLIADIIIAFLLWKMLPGSQITKLMVGGMFLLNPAMWYNSVSWGQIESLSALTAILAGIALVKRRANLVILAGGLALLTKQNVLPLIPLMAVGLASLKPDWKKVGSTIVLTCGITLIVYAPLIPKGEQTSRYVVETYWSAMSGQAHQHLASVNALNLWYGLGMNNIPDIQPIIGKINARGISNLLTLIGFALSCMIMLNGKQSWYQRCWGAIVFLSLWTFLFVTRMHERHSYMVIVYLTWIYPYLTKKWTYYVLSFISFVNVYAVWMGDVGIILPRLLAWIWVVVSLMLGAELLQQNGIKAKIVDRS